MGRRERLGGKGLKARQIPLQHHPPTPTHTHTVSSDPGMGMNEIWLLRVSVNIAVTLNKKDYCFICVRGRGVIQGGEVSVGARRRPCHFIRRKGDFVSMLFFHVEKVPNTTNQKDAQRNQFPPAHGVKLLRFVCSPCCGTSVQFLLRIPMTSCSPFDCLAKYISFQISNATIPQIRSRGISNTIQQFIARLVPFLSALCSVS